MNRLLFRCLLPVVLLVATLPQAFAAPGERPVLVLDPGNHTGFVKSAAFLPDGKRFVTFSEDKTIRVWDAATGLTVKTICLPSGPGAEGALFAGAVSPDGKTVAAAGLPFGSGKHGVLVYLISLETGEVERVLKGHKNIVTSMSFSFDGTLLATGSADNTVLIHRVATGAPAGELAGHADKINCVRFNPKSNHLATACQDGSSRIWSPAARGYTSVELKGPPTPANAVAWTPDGLSLATAGVDGAVRMWSKAGKAGKVYEPQEVTQTGRKGTAQVVTMAFAKSGKHLVYGGVAYQGTAGVLDMESGAWSLFPHHSNSVMASAVNPAGDTAITSGGDDNESVVWKIPDGTVVHRVAGDSKSVWNVGWAENGVLLWGNVNRGSAVPSTRPIEQAFSLPKLDFVPKPQRILLAQAKFGQNAISQPDFFTIDVTRGGQPHYSYTVPNKTGERIYSATLLPGDKLIVGTSSKLVLVDLGTKQVAKTFVGQSGIVTAVAASPDGFFATASSDQVIRVWTPEKDEPVLSVFFAGREWIAWTPEGYYAASPGGERLMGWQLNDGPEKVGRFYPAIQFRPTLFQPDVIGNLFAAKGDLPTAIKLTNARRKVPVPAVTVTDILPPQVRVVTPVAKAGGVPWAGQTIEVKAAARGVGANPVKSLRLLVDGRPYLGAKGVKAVVQPKNGDATATWTVTLPPGRHTLAVQADAGVSKGLSSPVEVVQAGDVKKPVLYVYAVGVNEYPGKLKLNFASSDAKSIANVFESRTNGVFEKVVVKLVTDQDATRANVLKGLDWLATSVTDRDVGMFYFSGHGARDDDGGFHLVPVDVDPQGGAKSLVPGDVVRDKLAEIPGRVVAVFDACHSGAAAENVRVGGPDALVRELLTDDCGVVVLCSSLGEEYSLESGEQKAGLYTFGLVEGLGGKADLNRDGLVFIHEAAAYASLRVRQLTRGAQNPTLGRSPAVRPFALTVGQAP